MRTLAAIWNWLLGRKPVRPELQDLMTDLEVEKTPFKQLSQRPARRYDWQD
jgi:hypothetical protein